RAAAAGRPLESGIIVRASPDQGSQPEDHDGPQSGSSKQGLEPPRPENFVAERWSHFVRAVVQVAFWAVASHRIASHRQLWEARFRRAGQRRRGPETKGDGRWT